MVLWVDLYRPKKLNGLDFHPEVTEQLRRLVEMGDIPHLLFYGPPGAGKKTRISAFLNELYGPSASKVRVSQRVIELKSKKIEISSLNSVYHIEINPSDAGHHDTAVVQQVIKEIAQSQSVTSKVSLLGALQPSSSSTAVSSTAVATSTTTPAQKHCPPPYKIVVLHGVESLSTAAQHGLRRTMEQYTKSCRLILCSDSATRITAPLKSRCFLIRIPAPNDAQIQKIISTVLTQQQMTLPEPMIQEIVAHADGNLRVALLSLESSCIGSLSGTTTLKLPDWQVMIQNIAQHIYENQTPGQILIIRNFLYQLLTNCIPPDTILQHLTLNLCTHTQAKNIFVHSFVRWAAFYDQRLSNSAKAVVHLEAFVTKCMAIIATVDIQ